MMAWFNTWIGLIFSGLISYTACGLWARWQASQLWGQAIRQEGPEAHQAKQGTPTAGGVAFLLAWVLSLGVLGHQWVWTPAVWCTVGATLLLAVVGGMDDALKMTQGKNNGISGYVKLGVQLVVGAGLGWLLYQTPNHGGMTQLFSQAVSLSVGFVGLAAVTVMATSNAVNLTDGLDGLAATTMIITLAGLAVLLGPQDPLTPVTLLLAGVLAGFWPHNRYKARLFMGDTGSLALGAFLASVCLLRGLEWWILWIGVVFVVEALSVCLQVAGFKLTGKRLFRMSPIHHHFELGGWSEIKVVTVFSLVQLLGVMGAFWVRGGQIPWPFI